MILYLLLDLEPPDAFRRLESFVPRLDGVWSLLDLVQVRAKRSSGGELVAALGLIRERAGAETGEEPRLGRAPGGLSAVRPTGRPLVLANDRADAALAAGADGVHVGAEDLPAGRVRELPGGAGLVIGATAHDAAEVRAAREAGADYVGLGTFHPSPTKPSARGDARRALRELGGEPGVPVYAIGGMTVEAVAEIAELRAVRGIVVSSAVQAAPDPAEAVRSLRGALDRLPPAGEGGPTERP